MRKVIILILIFTSLRVLASCCKKEGYNFRWSKFNLTNLDHSTDNPIPLSGNTININKYGIRLIFDNERVARIPNLGFNESYAFDCEALFRNRDTITSIDVITRQNFDNTHPAGSSVIQYMQARPTRFDKYYPVYEYNPVSQALPYINDDQVSTIHNNGIDFRFQKASPNLGQYRFVVTVSFKNGRTLSDSTEILFN